MRIYSNLKLSEVDEKYVNYFEWIDESEKNRLDDDFAS